MRKSIHRWVWSAMQGWVGPSKSVLRALIPSRFVAKVKRFLGGTYHSIPDCVIEHKDGRKIRVGPDNIYWGIYCGQDFEPGASEVVRRLVADGDVVVDVGANFGWYTTLFGNLVGEGGRVYAFEPVPKIFHQLSENIALNNLSRRCNAYRLALGDEHKTVQLNVFPDLPASHSSISSLGRSEYERFPAEMVLLDDFLKQENVVTASFLKCDVEGAELMALRGARKLLGEPAAPLVMFECNKETSEAFGYTPLGIFALCKELGFQYFFKILGSGFLEPLEFERAEHFDEINVIAVKEARVSRCKALVRD